MLTWTSSTGTKTFPFTVIRQPSKTVLWQEHRRADLVYENNPALQLSWPALFFNKPHVIALRTWINRMDGRMGWQDKLKLFWLKRATAIIAVSEAVRKRCWANATVIGNPYRNQLFRKLPSAIRDKDFVFMGRLVSDKGADIAIKALHKLKTTEPNRLLTLTIVGSGPDLSKLENLVDKLGLSNQVTFTGALSGEDLVACLNRHRFLLVPSTWEEPFGNVALEGMACGCLPIVSDGGGLPDAVGKAGLVISRNNVVALAAGIQNILDHPELEQQFRQASDPHLVMHHPQNVAAQYLKVIEQASTKS
ncbi:glycosyltransferase family 4 protein [Mucilaginibacter robiniae]|uniref:Glycosyltransferase family 4 protein n=2 Tax=Mucilaginibacter robiniae TaxID=2728022 RepID=A0A7L5E7X3_9SPHI|nr:glycosyltransferase family 4 protein [Mucilaginibacter robiniae]